MSLVAPSLLAVGTLAVAGYRTFEISVDYPLERLSSSGSLYLLQTPDSLCSVFGPFFVAFAPSLGALANKHFCDQVDPQF